MLERKRGRVATVIVTYNGRQWIDRCVQSLLRSDYPTDIIVVDNCSTDRTVTILRHDYPAVILIENRENSGFGQANNIGMCEAMRLNADYVFLMNQDAWVNPDTIGRLVEAAVTHSDYGIISPVHFNGNGDALDTGFAHYASLESPEQLSHCTDDLVELPFVNAAFWLIPIEVVRQVGGFDPFFFYCGEDVNYTHRIHFHSYKVGFVPSAYAFHDRGKRLPDRVKQVRLNCLFHWCEAFNVTRNSFGSFCYGPLALCKRVLVALLKCEVSDFKMYGQELWRMVTSWKMVLANRKFYTDKTNFWSR